MKWSIKERTKHLERKETFRDINTYLSYLKKLHSFGDYLFSLAAELLRYATVLSKGNYNSRQNGEV